MLSGPSSSKEMEVKGWFCVFFLAPKLIWPTNPCLGQKLEFCRLSFDTVAKIYIYSDVIWTIEQTEVTHIVSDRKLSKTLSDPTNESDD